MQNISFDKFVKRAITKFGDKFQYIEDSWNGYTNPIEIICPDHGLFQQTPILFLISKCGCKKCVSRAVFSRKEWIDKFHTIHSDVYDYSLFDFEPKNGNEIIKIVCQTHGVFEKTIYGHLVNGCEKCKGRYGLTTGEFIYLAHETHKGKYDYSLVRYERINDKIRIICPDHGEFLQSPALHLDGNGCPKCGLITRTLKNRKSQDKFIEDAVSVHGLKYDYSKTEYINSLIKVQIICHEHEPFWQLPGLHLKGQGCPKCGSKYFVKQNNWLDFLGVPDIYGETRQVYIYFKDGSHIVADGYNPETRTIYEFWGDKHHGNPMFFNPSDINPINGKSYGELYKYTLSKIQKILEADYKLIQIWEYEYDDLIEKGEIIEKSISNIALRKEKLGIL